ncbi:MAG: hypothetical protein KGM47_03090, partial [Acidobacteriota bacterium]|nr:hypothetical protein [Acidobacteriota bacterium]
MDRASLLPGLIVKNRRSETAATAAQARMLASTRVRAGVSVLLAVFVCSVCAFGRSAQTAAHKLVAARYLNAAPGVGYVGSKACARCHEDIYREFKQTAMGRSMSVASDPRLPRPAAPVKVRRDLYNRDFAIYCEGRNLYQSESETAADGTVVFKDARRIAYALGAGANGIGYIVQDGNRLLEAPLSYYTQTHTWGISPGY